jgi:hypothetical protein
MVMVNKTKDFYPTLAQVTNNTIATSALTYQNAYAIFDELNVANIHNVTFNTSANGIISTDTLFQTRTLADHHEFGLAYNASDPVRAISGAVLAGQIIQQLNTSISTNGTNPLKLGIQFGAYGSFQAFFGLANLTAASPDFYGIPDYASSMIFELFSNATAPAKALPSVDELFVRFGFNNGTSSSSPEPVMFPLFGQSNIELSWTDFQNGMNKFAVDSQTTWCQMCGNTTGVCASTTAGTTSGSGSGSSGGGKSSKISKAVAGVIGAMVTLAVILLIEALILLLGGLRVVSKNRAGAGAATGNGVKA